MKQWIISQMDTAPSVDGMTDVVKTVHWYRQCQDGEYMASIGGASGFAAPHEASFTPYDQLTFDQVCGWVEASVDVADIDAQLDEQIANQKNPPIVVLPLPWDSQ